MPAVADVALGFAVAGVLLAVVRAEAVLARGAGAAGSSTGLLSHVSLPFEKLPLPFWGPTYPGELQNDTVQPGLTADSAG